MWFEKLKINSPHPDIFLVKKCKKIYARPEILTHGYGVKGRGWGIRLLNKKDFNRVNRQELMNQGRCTLKKEQNTLPCMPSVTRTV